MKGIRQWFGLMGLLVILGLLSAACGGGAKPTSEPTDTSEPSPTVAETEEVTEEAEVTPAGTEEPTEEPTDTPTPTITPTPSPTPNVEVEGEFLVNGSSVVFPITQNVAEIFQDLFPNVEVTVGVSGEPIGFERFCNGETAINNAHRPISDEEAQSCEENDVEWVELLIAYDAIAIVANPENDFLTCLTVDELRTIWEPEAEGEITSWDQVRASFPDEPIVLYGPSPDRGIFDFFTGVIVGTQGMARQDYDRITEEDPLQEMPGDLGTLAFFDYADYQRHEGLVNLVAVDAGNGCVEPSLETIHSGEYLLSRPLYIYINAGMLEEDEAVAAFVNYYLSDEGLAAVDEANYVRAEDAVYERDREIVSEVITGRSFSAEEPTEEEPTFEPTEEPIDTPAPTDTPEPTQTEPPTMEPTEEPTNTPAPTDTPEPTQTEATAEGD